MHNLVISTYDQLVSRLQRGGTVIKPVVPMQEPGVLTFKVAKNDDSIDESYVRVDVMPWYQKNVYVTHENKVQVTLSHLAGQQSQFTFFPRIGNCPTLDKVEARIREEVDNRINSDNGDAQRQAELEECERIANEECPVPSVTGISRKRQANGTYTVKAAIAGLTPAAVRQLFEIERSLDAIVNNAGAALEPSMHTLEKTVRRNKQKAV